MYATLIICQSDSEFSAGGEFADNEIRSTLNMLTQTTKHLHLKLTADQLTTGKLLDLLVCLDELGFSESETD